MVQPTAANQGEKITIIVEKDLEDLVPGFLKNRRTDVKSMTEALAQGDFDKIRVLGHSMKGSGGGYGFDAVTDIGRVLEIAAKESATEELQKQIRELEIYLDRITVVYE
ncbi:MAG: Hpt domain-containing protein [Dehalococcoidia bacterium]|nr:Hpt domain-containing protein [Dehalococcoidia bacterium]